MSAISEKIHWNVFQIDGTEEASQYRSLGKEGQAQNVLDYLGNLEIVKAISEHTPNIMCPVLIMSCFNPKPRSYRTDKLSLALSEHSFGYKVLFPLQFQFSAAQLFPIL